MFEDGSLFTHLLVDRLNYVIYVVLLMIGLWAMVAKNNLIKKLIGMSIFQTAIILFYVSIGVKEGATIPIYLSEHDPHGESGEVNNAQSSQPERPQVLEASLVAGYNNPLPHVLMLTAIVVGVATLGLALSICLRIYRAYGTVEEDELLLKLESEELRSSSGSRTRRWRPRSKRKAKVPKSFENTRSRKGDGDSLTSDGSQDAKARSRRPSKPKKSKDGEAS